MDSFLYPDEQFSRHRDLLHERGLLMIQTALIALGVEKVPCRGINNLESVHSHPTWLFREHPLCCDGDGHCYAFVTWGPLFYFVVQINIYILVYYNVILTSNYLLYVQSSPLHFSKEPQSQDALHGRSAMLRCEVSEVAGVQYSWLQDGQPVKDSERRFMEDGNLKFSAVDRHLDTGNFQCVAKSLTSGEEARSINASFNIKFTEMWTKFKRPVEQRLADARIQSDFKEQKYIKTVPHASINKNVITLSGK
ncbi:hypothetical protein QTP70_003491 [Hemibagrus guttatus]|uniref:Ig-like domain-containing protein n=1 Tax=Hemibagrus guttatus TaxID=175788 RepID=A0AAE0RG50_9TELE|nr:hypothetical protein QTP70_003491 [Hemibagrus guttatus]